MADELMNCGQAEGPKAVVHLGLFALTITCLAYNAIAWDQRREKHLLTAVSVYSALATYEFIQMRRHWNAR